MESAQPAPLATITTSDLEYAYSASLATVSYRSAPPSSTTCELEATSDKWLVGLRGHHTFVRQRLIRHKRELSHCIRRRLECFKTTVGEPKLATKTATMTPARTPNVLNLSGENPVIELPIFLQGGNAPGNCLRSLVLLRHIGIHVGLIVNECDLKKRSRDPYRCKPRTEPTSHLDR